MFTLVAFEAARAAASAALAALAPAADQHITIDGNSIIVPEEMPNVIGKFVAHGTQAVAGNPILSQLQSPSLRRTLQPDISGGNDTNAAIIERQVHLHPQSPIPLDKGEGLQGWLANGALAAAFGLIAVWLSDGPIAPVKGPIYTLRYTTVTPAAMNAWTLGALTVIQPLATGKYQVVGARCISVAQCGLFRLVFTGYDWRPGGVITTGYLLEDVRFQRDGELGVWGEFDDRHLPRIEVLGIAAVANPDLYLDLIKVG